MKKAKIGIIGEYSPSKRTHPMLNQNLEWLKKDFDFEYEWIDTLKIEKEGTGILEELAGVWSASGSPFNSLEGALKAIEYARVNNIPHLGTCGGFQHAMIEYARNVLGIKEATHEEYDINASMLFISKLTCSLAGKSFTVNIRKRSKVFESYNSEEAVEDYYCNFGINPAFKDQLLNSKLLISGVDQDGEIRIVELPENNFFVATLFVPHSNAAEDRPHPIIKMFTEECIRKAGK
jgi:CTP synthase (UTP-ammonia lyase)